MYLDEIRNKQYLDLLKLDEYLRSQILDSDMYYIILDEIQLIKDLDAVLNSFLYMDNVYVYVTEEGILIIGIIEFLLNPNSLDI